MGEGWRSGDGGRGREGRGLRKWLWGLVERRERKKLGTETPTPISLPPVPRTSPVPAQALRKVNTAENFVSRLVVHNIFTPFLQPMSIQTIGNKTLERWWRACGCGLRIGGLGLVGKG